MNLSIKELNDLYYCIGKVRFIEGVKMISNEVLDELGEKLWDEIVRVNDEDEAK